MGLIPNRPFYVVMLAWIVATAAQATHRTGNDELAYPLAIVGIALFLWCGWIYFGRRPK